MSFDVDKTRPLDKRIPQIGDNINYELKKIWLRLIEIEDWVRPIEKSVGKLQWDLSKTKNSEVQKKP